MLGPIEAWHGDVQLDVGPRRERALLAVLATSPGVVVRSDRLMSELWGDPVPDTAQRSMYTHVSHLRKALGAARILRRGDGYVLVLEPYELDAETFSEGLAGGRRLLALDPVAAVERIDEALSLWRGTPFEGFGDDVPTLEIEAARLCEERLSGREDRFEAMLTAGSTGPDPTAQIDAMLAEHPLRERLWRARMLSLYRSGRPSEALRSYQELRSLLVEELGIEPSPETARLEEQILLNDPDLDTRPIAPHNLPSPPSDFIGRDHEIRQLQKQLHEHRLVTLVGPGGAGKTRLAIEVARSVVGAYRDGVWIVDLASIEDEELITGSVASVFGVRAHGGTALLDAVVEHLRSRRVLLVLDNCEHLRHACSRLLDRLLGAVSQLTVLATSREPLGLPGEIRHALSGLAVPEEVDRTPSGIASAESVRLFVNRATAVDPAAEFDDAAMAVVGAICRLLDGLPLAVEIAAAKIAFLDPDEILRRLDDPLGLLVDASQPERAAHTSVESLLDWSYDLLSVEEREVFDGLGVFVGDFGLEAALVVAGVGDEPRVVDAIGHLARASMIEARWDSSGGRRYRLLETMRRYALDHLESHGDRVRCAARHAEHFRRFACAARVGLRSPERRTWIDRIEVELSNLRAAFDWCSAHEPLDRTMEFAQAIGTYSLVSGSLEEGVRQLSSLTESDDREVPPALRADALSLLGIIHFYRNSYDEARPDLEEAIDLFRRVGDATGLAEALARRGHLAFSEGDQETAGACFIEALEVCDGIDFDIPRAWPMLLSAQAALWGGDSSDAVIDQLETARWLFERADDSMGQTHAMMLLTGIFSGARDQPERASDIAEEMLELTERKRDRFNRPIALFCYGEAIARGGDLERGERILQRAARAAYDEGVLVNLGLSLLFLGAVAAAAAGCSMRPPAGWAWPAGVASGVRVSGR